MRSAMYSKERVRRLKLAVVGSMDMDMTVTAERIPLKGETLLGDSVRFVPGEKGRANGKVDRNGYPIPDESFHSSGKSLWEPEKRL